MSADPESASKLDDSNFNIFFGPKLDIMLRYGKTVRPFLGFAGGYASGWVTNEGAAYGGEYKDSSSGFRVIGRLGARLFGEKTFSFDPAFVFTYGRDSINREIASTGDFDVTSAGYTMGLVFGFSGWL